MQRAMIRYRIKPDHVARNEELVRAVYAELHAAKPGGLRYATFRLADGVSFVHIVEKDTPDGSNPLDAVAAFATFRQNIADRCDQTPVETELSEIGSYRFIGQ